MARAFDDAPPGDDKALRALLGGKGKSLFDMTALGLPVPPGFTLVTEVCRQYLADGWSDDLDAAIDETMRALERRSGLRFGDSDAPLLVSVRSGSAESMPGMMDTILNVGLNAGTVRGLARRHADPSFATDCADRLRQSYIKAVGDGPPECVRAQLRGAIEAVFKSWNSARARAYRRIEGLSDAAGTAVNVQMMVFGNRDERSGTGVVFSRDPSTGEARLYGDVLFRAQGEDVVAGTHATLNIDALGEILPDVWQSLRDGVQLIERRYRDLVEVEFTIESGRLWILQSRVGKRSPRAALRIAHDMAQDAGFPLSRAEACARVESLLSGAGFVKRRGAPPHPVARGLAASPGVATGILATRSEDAAALASKGQAVVLARPETSPSDIEGIAAAAGLLTARGGLASHAAVVARGWGKPAVVGIVEMTVMNDGILVGSRRIPAGALVALDGETGEVFDAALEVEDATPPEVAVMRVWRDEAAAPAPPAITETSDDELLMMLAIKGMTTIAALADILGLARPETEERLSRLGDALERPNASFVKAGPQAHARCGAVIADHRAKLLDGAARILDQFRPFNDAFKALVTDWQMRASEGGLAPNDHADAAYDAAVLARFRVVHAEISDWLGDIRPQGGIAFFARRFVAAMRRIDAGETAFLVSPRVDSYHNVWFELHEYLIRLAGRTRQQEEAH
ncbi:MAG: pyruvate, phosphate dikinase [Micropepsaceae bacterium]